jgi:hypothetical protein
MTRSRSRMPIPMAMPRPVFTTKRRARALRNGARVGGNDRGEHRCTRSA